MATNFDKALYQAPQGMSNEDMGGDIEIGLDADLRGRFRTIGDEN